MDDGQEPASQTGRPTDRPAKQQQQEQRSKRRYEKKNVKTEKIMCYAPDVRSRTDFGFGAVLWHLIISHLSRLKIVACSGRGAGGGGGGSTRPTAVVINSQFHKSRVKGGGAGDQMLNG